MLKSTPNVAAIGANILAHKPDSRQNNTPPAKGLSDCSIMSPLLNVLAYIPSRSATAIEARTSSDRPGLCITDIPLARLAAAIKRCTKLLEAGIIILPFKLAGFISCSIHHAFKLFKIQGFYPGFTCSFKKNKAHIIMMSLFIKFHMVQIVILHLKINRELKGFQQ